MIRPLALVATLAALTACASSPDPEPQTAPTVLRGFGPLSTWPGVWKLAPTADEGPVSGTLRIFPALAGTFLETTLVYRFDDGVPQLIRQLWTPDRTGDGYRVWTFADGGAHHEGTLRPTDASQRLVGMVEGVDAAGQPLRGELSVTTTKDRLRVEMHIDAAGDSVAEFVR